MKMDRKKMDLNHQGEKLSAAKLRMVNGVSAGLEALAWIISDPGDVVIVPTPTYARWNIGLKNFLSYPIPMHTG